MRKGQVSFSIIIGIVMLIIIGIIIYLVSSIDQGSIEVSSFPEVESCLKFVGDKAVKLSALSGADMNQEFTIGNITVIQKDNMNLLKSQEEIEMQIADYIDQNIRECIKSLIPEHEIASIGEPKTNVTLKQHSMMMELNMPIKIKTGETEQKHENFIADLATDYHQTIYYVDLIIGNKIMSSWIDESLIIESGGEVILTEKDTILIISKSGYEFVAVI